MFLGLEQEAAMRLAISAHSFVGELSDSLVAPEESTPDLTGLLVHAMPGIFERAILSTPSLPPEQAMSVCEKFFPAFKEIMRVTSNAAGFSNSIQKLLFNVAFGRAFESRSSEMRATIRHLWDMSLADHVDPLEYLSRVLVTGTESTTGLQLASDERLSSIRDVLAKKFADIHATCR